MSKNKGQAWNTKYGARRVRHDAPTIGEAIAAARDLSDELDVQVEIAASLIGLPNDQILAELLKATPHKDVSKSVVLAGRASAPRTIVVERKPSRRVISSADARTVRKGDISRSLT
jgi:hypothetical protein